MNANKKVRKKIRRTTKACTNCQRRKIKCNNGHPCLSCVASQAKCHYSDQLSLCSDSFFLNPGSLDCDRKGVLSRLGSNAPTHFQKFLADVTTFLDCVNPQLRMTLDTSELGSYSGDKSIETALVGRQSQFLNRFSNILSMKAEQTLSVYFGLYSSLLYFTPMGISWLAQKLISYSDDRATRETIFLVLKYLDANTANHRSNQVLRLSSPLKYYASLRSLAYDDETIIRHILTETQRLYEDKSFISDPYSAFKEPSHGFSFSVSLLERHEIISNSSELNQVSLKALLKEGDSILCLCTEFFEKSIFSQIHDMNLLTSLLSLIEHVYWREDNSYLGRLVSITSRRSLDAGLNRWEYYVMKNEAVADGERHLWWNIYWWDKWHASVTGKPPSIPDEMSWCLFSKDVMQLGVEDSMDCLTLIQMVQLDQEKAAACILFCRILLGRIISRVFSVVLYNRTFTDYRLFTHAIAKNLAGTMEQLKTEVNTIFDIFTAFEEKIRPFLKSNLEKAGLFEVYVQSTFIAVTSFQSMETLLLRIQNISQTGGKFNLFEPLIHCEERISKYSAEILLCIMKTNDQFQVIKSSWAAFTTILNATSCLVKKPGNDPIYHLSLICGVVSRYMELLDCTEESANSWTRLMQGTRLSLILARICCQAIMFTQKISAEDLKMALLNYGSACAEIFDTVLDIHCIWFKQLLWNEQRSCFSEDILRNIDKNVDDFARNKVTDVKSKTVAKTEGEDNAHIMETTTQAIDMQSLENFLKADASLSFLTTLWDSAPPSIFDLGEQQFGPSK